MVTTVNGDVTTHAPDAADPNTLTLHWHRDRRGGRVAVLVRRGDAVLAQERIDPFSDAELRKHANDWTLKLRQPVDVLLARLRSIAGEILAADAKADAAVNTPPGPGAQGQSLTLAWPEPWPASVRLSDVLDEAAAYVRQYVALPVEAADVVALWCTWCYVVDRGYVAPILSITSPAKRCGKTTLLRLIGVLAPRVLLASNVSPAALFRVIEAEQPTLLVDEADTFAEENDELRGLLNSGHTKDTALVLRCEGDNHEPRRFSTWGAKALAAIGRLPGTVEDRSIVVRLQRRRRTDDVGRVTPAVLAAGQELAQKFMRWATDDGELFFLDADPPVPAALDDRAADNWRPLLAIADLAGREWPTRALAVAVALSADRDGDDQDLPIRLLADLQAIFESDSRAENFTSELIDLLCRIEEAPWATLPRGRPITPHKLGRMLAGFGVKPRHSETGNRYSRQDLEPAWLRYCGSPPDQSFNPLPGDAKPYEIRI